MEGSNLFRLNIGFISFVFPVKQNPAPEHHSRFAYLPARFGIYPPLFQVIERPVASIMAGAHLFSATGEVIKLCPPNPGSQSSPVKIYHIHHIAKAELALKER